MRRRGGRAHAPRSLTFLYGLLAAAAVLAVGAPVTAVAAASESCVYDVATKKVTAAMLDGSQATLVVAGGQIWFGASPAACGAATTTNTDSISVAGNAGTIETLTIDQRGGFFGPGAAAESNTPEIEIATALGDSTDRVVVHGTEAPDSMAAGQNGFATSTDGDVDITFAPSAFKLEVHLHGGDDYFNGRGESGAGLHFLGPITASGGEGNESLLRGSSEPDVLDGGPGNDIVQAQESNDDASGGAGDDTVTGGSGSDTLTGGPGADRLIGSDGADVLLARDDEVDLFLNGGPDADEAHVDANDPGTVSVEIVIRPSESCSYSGATKALSLTMTPRSTATLVIANGNEIWFGETPEQCGSATTTNTDSISIKGAVGTVETLVLDQRGGFFGPGATPESNTPEIEIATDLGDSADRVVIWGTDGADFMAAGQSGVATSSDGDVDVTFSPMTFNLETHLLGGNDHFDARGTGGAGLKFLGPVVVTGGEGSETLLRGGDANDVIDGGAGNDVLDAQEGNDILRAGSGDDTMAGGGGNDSLDGGPGIDTFNGNDGDDTFAAQDDEADALLSGGPGADTAHIDTGVDPTPVTVETIHGDGTPPPPQTTTCTYDAATDSVTASIAPGEAASLIVAGTEVRFGPAPLPCGAATTTNTDSITVRGATGSVETLTIDQTGGLFAPGATAETGSSEIEISVLLADASDLVVVKGTEGPDTLSFGTNGFAVNTDADVDVTLSPFPNRVEVFGLGGANTITGRGGLGAGGDFPAKLILRAGDAGDTLTGGLGNDELYGGAGADTIEGRAGADLALGGGGGDTISGNDGDDDLSGGSGADVLIGGDGSDTLRAADGQADPNVNGGQGSDTAFYDAALDFPVACETLVPA
jgi:Ca2+-binding RTX toxin-like protein